MTTRSKPYSEMSSMEQFKARSRSYANVYERRGKLIRQTCDRCGEKAQKHHPDYAKPLAVVWLCIKCHCNLHKAEREAHRAEFAAGVRDILRRRFG